MMMDEENQTQFAQDEPLLEAQTAVQDGTLVDPAIALKQKKRTRLIKVAVGLFVVLFVSLLVVALTLPKQSTQVVLQPTPSPVTQEQKEQSQLEATLNLLHEDISKADPLTSDLPVPPIDFALTLEGNSNAN